MYIGSEMSQLQNSSEKAVELHIIEVHRNC